MGKMPANPIQLLGAGLVVTVGLAATSGAVSAPATGSRLAADAAQGKSKIAFISRGLQRRPALYVVSADGSGQRRLTGPVWSVRLRGRPTGGGSPSKACTPAGLDPARCDRSTGVYVVNADGSFRREAGAHRERSCLVARRADDRVLQRLKIYLMNADGSEHRALTQRCGTGAGVSCMVARRAETRLPSTWRSAANYCFHLYVLNSDGSGLRNLTSKLAAGRVSVPVPPPTRLVSRRTEDRIRATQQAARGLCRERRRQWGAEPHAEADGGPTPLPPGRPTGGSSPSPASATATPRSTS